MKFHEVVLQTPDLNALEFFYGVTLGLPVTLSEHELGVRVGFTLLRWVRGPSSPYHLAFNLPGNHLQQARESLRVPLLSLPDGQAFAEFPRWRARSFYFLDPAGNILECIVRDGLEWESRLPFGVSSWLCVSEVGLVVKNVSATADWLAKSLDVGYFDGEGNPEFCALGDDLGLLILVPEGRVWHPTTDVAASPSALRLRFDDHELVFPPLEVRRDWRAGEMVQLNGRVGVVMDYPQAPEDHSAVWFGEASEAWTIPSEYLRPTPVPRIRH